MDAKARQKLRRFIRELEQVRGRHTELVSVYVPKDYDLNKIIQHLQGEQSTAKNIKDARTRSNVIDSLERCIRHLRLFKKTPDNGLAVFAGNIAAQEGKVDIKVWSIEPPDPIKVRLYRCDQTFVLDILKSQMEYNEVYGLIVMDRREATIGLLKGTNIEEREHLTSGVPGKFKAGGQCQDPNTIVYNGKRIRICEVKVGDKIKGFDLKKRMVKYSRCVDFWKVKKDSYLKIKTKSHEIKCSEDHVVFVFQNGRVSKKIASELNEDELLINEKFEPEKIILIEKRNEKVELIDISVEQENFIANCLLVHNSSQRFERLIEGMAIEFYKRVAETCKKEFLGMKELKGILVGGPGQTKEDFIEYLNTELKKKIKAIQDLTYTDESGLHDLVDKSKDIFAQQAIMEEKNIVNRFLTVLGSESKRAVYGEEKVRKAFEIGAVDILLISESLDDKKIEEFEDLAANSGSEVKIISNDTREGKQIAQLGGVAAILRFAIG